MSGQNNDDFNSDSKETFFGPFNAGESSHRLDEKPDDDDKVEDGEEEYKAEGLANSFSIDAKAVQNTDQDPHPREILLDKTMHSEKLREDSFKTHIANGKCSKRDSRILARNGFYYNELGDNIVCFCCHKAKSDWDERQLQVICVIHHALSHQCSFANKLYQGTPCNTGEQAGQVQPIREVLAETAAEESDRSWLPISQKCFLELPRPVQSEAVTGKAVNQGEPAAMCTVCEDRPCNAILTPCMHRCACSVCANIRKNRHEGCPECHASIDGVFVQSS